MAKRKISKSRQMLQGFRETAPKSVKFRKIVPLNSWTIGRHDFVEIGKIFDPPKRQVKPRLRVKLPEPEGKIWQGIPEGVLVKIPRRFNTVLECWLPRNRAVYRINRKRIYPEGKGLRIKGSRDTYAKFVYTLTLDSGKWCETFECAHLDSIWNWILRAYEFVPEGKKRKESAIPKSAKRSAWFRRALEAKKESKTLRRTQMQIRIENMVGLIR